VVSRSEVADSRDSYFSFESFVEHCCEPDYGLLGADKRLSKVINAGNFKLTRGLADCPLSAQQKMRGGFRPGIVIWLRVRAVGLKGVMGAWCDPAKLMVVQLDRAHLDGVRPPTTSPAEIDEIHRLVSCGHPPRPFQAELFRPAALSVPSSDGKTEQNAVKGPNLGQCGEGQSNDPGGASRWGKGGGEDRRGIP